MPSFFQDCMQSEIGHTTMKTWLIYIYFVFVFFWWDILVFWKGFRQKVASLKGRRGTESWEWVYWDTDRTIHSALLYLCIFVFVNNVFVESKPLPHWCFWKLQRKCIFSAFIVSGQNMGWLRMSRHNYNGWKFAAARLALTINIQTTIRLHNF